MKRFTRTASSALPSRSTCALVNGSALSLFANRTARDGTWHVSHLTQTTPTSRVPVSMTGLQRSTVRTGVEAWRTLVGEPWCPPSSGTDREKACHHLAERRAQQRPPIGSRCAADDQPGSGAPRRHCNHISYTRRATRRFRRSRVFKCAPFLRSRSTAGFDP